MLYRMTVACNGVLEGIYETDSLRTLKYILRSGFGTRRWFPFNGGLSWVHHGRRYVATLLQLA